MVAVRLVQANIKARDDVALGRFRAAALGWNASGAGNGATSVTPDGFVWTDPAAPVCLDIIAVPDPQILAGGVRLDLATTSPAHHAELMARMVALGAAQDDVPSTVLTDLEGNLVRVLEPQDRYRATGPIAAVVVDCADPRALAGFWGEALSWTRHEVTGDSAALRSPTGTGPYLEFVRHGRRTGPGRIHLDVVPDPGGDQAAEVARLRTLGASPADVGQGAVPWVVLSDPEGNHFCVLAPG